MGGNPREKPRKAGAYAHRGHGILSNGRTDYWIVQRQCCPRRCPDQTKCHQVIALSKNFRFEHLFEIQMFAVVD
jgi:hypothetical protein